MYCYCYILEWNCSPTVCMDDLLKSNNIISIMSPFLISHLISRFLRVMNIKQKYSGTNSARICSDMTGQLQTIWAVKWCDKHQVSYSWRLNTVPVCVESASGSVLPLSSGLRLPQSSSVAMVLWMFWYLQEDRGFILTHSGAMLSFSKGHFHKCGL